MNLKNMAYDFAVCAYSDRYRKAELDKPLVFHAIDVANKLERYGFDDNVIAAGYLHDIVEDTKYTKDDILDIFGSDITSLVMGATERDKTSTWEKRKSDSIHRVRDLDIRHKAIVACDKISNIEDLRLKFGKEGREDFSKFNRGKDRKNWYWREIYKSLITNQNENQPMFLKLKKNINDICNISDILKMGYYPDIDVIDSSLDISNVARELHYKKSEILKIGSFVNNNNYVVEFTGSNSYEKRNMIYKLKTYFILSGFNVLVMDDFNFFEEHVNDIKRKYDIVLLDNAFLDKITNMCVMNSCGKINYNKFNNYIYHNKKKKIIDYIDMFVVLKNKDDYCYNSSLDKCLNKYISNEKAVYKKNNYEINSCDLLAISSFIIDNMRSKYLKEAKEMYITKPKMKVKKNI